LKVVGLLPLRKSGEGSLRELLARSGKLSPESTGRVAAGICITGKAHGDIRPENILVGPGRTITLLDGASAG
jgi:hypothetical protein